MSAFSFGDFGKLDAVSLGKVHAEDAEDPITEERWPYASELYKLYIEAYRAASDPRLEGS